MLLRRYKMPLLAQLPDCKRISTLTACGGDRLITIDIVYLDQAFAFI